MTTNPSSNNGVMNIPITLSAFHKGLVGSFLSKSLAALSICVWMFSCVPARAAEGSESGTHSHGSGPAHSHDEPAPTADEHGHAHGDEGEKTAQVTVWGDRFEIFLEHPYIVAGEPTAFVTHVTDLEKLVPRTEGPVEFIIRLGADPPIGRTVKAPSRDGIYIPKLVFPNAGTWAVSILIPNDGKNSIVELPPTEVYATSDDVAHAPNPEEIEGITFLKEQQWKFPFRTEVLKVKDGVLSVPESAVVYGKEGALAYVHIAGETVQQRILEIAAPKNGTVEVLSGLKEGDRVVVRGADAIAVSASSDEGHGHDHGAAGDAVHESSSDDGHSHDAAGGADDHGHAHGPDEAAHGAADHLEPGTLKLSQEMRDSLDLTTVVLGKGTLVRTLDVYGWIRPRQENLTEVRAPIAGIVKEILATPGESLKDGDPIVELQSREILDWQQTVLSESNRRKKFEDMKTLLASEGRAKMVELLGGLQVDSAEVTRISNELDLIENAGAGSVAQREINRIQGERQSAKASLYAKEILAEAYGLSRDFIAQLKTPEATIQADPGDLPPDYLRQLREIEFNIQSSKMEETIALTNLQSIGFDEGQLERLKQGDPDAIVNTITLRAEKPFLVTEIQMKRQSSLNVGDPILSGIDYAVVLVDAEVPEVEIAKVLSRASDTIAVRIPALGDQSFEAQVRHFDTTVHAGDRKSHLVLEMKNTKDLTLRDGMAASVGIPVEIRPDALSLPKESILTDGFDKVVFVAEGDVYRKQSVTIGVDGFDSTEVLSGIKPGQRIVVSGAPALYLSLKSQEGSLVVGHGHAH